MSEDDPRDHLARVGHGDTVAQVDALFSEGKRIQSGNGGTPDNRRAFSLFLQAAEAGHPEAQFLVFESYRNGRGVAQQEVQAFTWLKRSAESGFEKAFVPLAIYYSRDSAKNDDEAIKWYKKAADTGSYGACILLSQIFKARGDRAEEITWTKEAALRGDADSLWEIRKIYERRDGVEIDLPAAYAWLSLYEDSFTTRKNSEELASFMLSSDISKYRTSSLELTYLMSPSQIDQGKQLYLELAAQRAHWVRKKANQGSPDAEFYLGWCYRDGSGVPQDYAQAVRYWRMAAEQGDRRAQHNLGVCYSDGQGVPQDYVEAVRWFQRAAEQGHASAQNHLGICYAYGKGVPLDSEQAIKWYRKAAEQGDADAQYTLADSSYYGNGVQREGSQAAVGRTHVGHLKDSTASDGRAPSMKIGKAVSESLHWFGQTGIPLIVFTAMGATFVYYVSGALFGFLKWFFGLFKSWPRIWKDELPRMDTLIAILIVTAWFGGIYWMIRRSRFRSDDELPLDVKILRWVYGLWVPALFVALALALVLMALRR